MVVLFVILALYVNPVIHFVDTWRNSKNEQTQLEELRQENADLRARAAVLSDPEAAERAARELGMVGQGEQSYVIRQKHR